VQALSIPHFLGKSYFRYYSLFSFYINKFVSENTLWTYSLWSRKSAYPVFQALWGHTRGEDSENMEIAVSLHKSGGS